MLHDRFPHFAAVQILRNYLKHRGDAVVGNIQKNRYSQENRNICRSGSTKMFAEYGGVRSSTVNKRRKRNLRRCKSDREIRDSSTIGMPTLEE